MLIINLKNEKKREILNFLFLTKNHTVLGESTSRVFLKDNYKLN
jgi:hypothetical protein